jgi:hypothetical protein
MAQPPAHQRTSTDAIMALFNPRPVAAPAAPPMAMGFGHHMPQPNGAMPPMYPPMHQAHVGGYYCFLTVNGSFFIFCSLTHLL